MQIILTFVGLCGLVVGQSGRDLCGNPRSSSRPECRRNTGRPLMTLEIARKLDSLDSVDEFFNMISESSHGKKDFSIASRFDGIERSSGKAAVPARCMPELQTVPLDIDNNDTAVFYFPSCTRIKRCGGCCHFLLSCQPKEQVTRLFEVIVSRLTVDGEMIAEERKIVPLEEHTRCECDCKMKAEDCHPKHVYIEELCECRCQNTDEESKCDRDRDLKYWDPSTCSCHCVKETMCNLGWWFNPDSCRCEREQTSVYGIGRDTAYRYAKNSKSQDTLPDIMPPVSDTRRRSNKDDPEYK